MVTLGTGNYTYEVVENWAKLPDGWGFKEVAAVGVDANDNVYAFNRGEHPMMVFDRHGNFLRSWGEGVFPRAHGMILTALYLPTAAMLVGLILRGVAFDFRYKARDAHQPRWDRLFWIGSALAALAQGYMLGLYITGFARTWLGVTFALAIALGLAAGYVLLGACWLLIKTSGALQLEAVRWAQRALLLCGIGVAAVSAATPLVSPRVFGKWFTLPNVVLLLPIPVATAALFLIAARALRRLPVRLGNGNEYGVWVPFACAIGIFVLAFYGLAYSLFPFIVIDQLTIWQAASAPESLLVILVGAAIVLPAILAYTVFAYRVFRGKARNLTYG